MVATENVQEQVINLRLLHDSVTRDRQLMSYTNFKHVSHQRLD